MTLMTEYEQSLLERVKNSGGVFVGSEIKNPSQEFLLAAIKIDPFVIRFVENQSYAVRMAAVRQNGDALQYVNVQTPEIERAALRVSEIRMMTKRVH